MGGRQMNNVWLLIKFTWGLDFMNESYYHKLTTFYWINGGFNICSQDMIDRWNNMSSMNLIVKFTWIHQSFVLYTF